MGDNRQTDKQPDTHESCTNRGQTDKQTHIGVYSVLVCVYGGYFSPGRGCLEILHWAKLTKRIRNCSPFGAQKNVY